VDTRLLRWMLLAGCFLHISRKENYNSDCYSTVWRSTGIQYHESTHSHCRIQAPHWPITSQKIHISWSDAAGSHEFESSQLHIQVLQYLHHNPRTKLAGFHRSIIFITSRAEPKVSRYIVEIPLIVSPVTPATMVLLVSIFIVCIDQSAHKKPISEARFDLRLQT